MTKVPPDLDPAIQERREAAVDAIHKMLQSYTAAHPDLPLELREFVRHQPEGGYVDQTMVEAMLMCIASTIAYMPDPHPQLKQTAKELKRLTRFFQTKIKERKAKGTYTDPIPLATQH